MKNYLFLILSLTFVLTCGENTGGYTGFSHLTDVKAISAGDSHAAAITTNGELWIWGSNGYGQLGDGATERRKSPVRIETATFSNIDWKEVSAGRGYTIAIKDDDRLWAWGDNMDGQLGKGNTFINSNNLTPARMGTGQGTGLWKAVSIGLYSMAIQSNGSIWDWGPNSFGGSPIKVATSNPTQIGTDTDWATVSTGKHHTVAIKTTGSIWAWGYNDFGQLGDGTTSSRTVFTRIGTDTNWATVSAGMYHTAAIKTNGTNRTLWAWGYNGEGQLGTNNTTSNVAVNWSPVQVGTDTDWESVSAGDGHTMAIKKDGTLWGWGWNGDGQLGDGTMTDRKTPVRIGKDSDWKAVSAGDGYTIALKDDGSVWSWGFNAEGQLGNGTLLNRKTPGRVIIISEP